VPEISRFFGIIITMYFKDHAPPHFHARYNEHEALIAIESLGIVEGSLPPKALSLVVEWASQHRAELLGNWQGLSTLGRFQKIAPLA
jgi:hypothetical protein